jgi:hypothetical protein
MENKSFLIYTSKRFRNSFKTFFLILFSFLGLKTHAQNCSTLYIITGSDGNVYSIDVATGAKTLVTTLLNSKENLAVGPDPLSLGTTIFTSSKKGGGSAIYKGSTDSGINLPTGVTGLTTNPATTGATAGYVYGISSTRKLIKVSPSPSANLGTITGDGTWDTGTIEGDGFFDGSGNLYTIVQNGAANYLYKIDIAALTATKQVQLSGDMPLTFQGIAFLNDKIYVGEIFSTGDKATAIYYVQLFEFNPNTGQGITGATITFNNTKIDIIDLASCGSYTLPPIGTPTCNELYGIEWLTHKIFRFDPSNLSSTLISSGTQGDQGNMAFGPVPSNLNQNQFVTSPNSVTGNIYKDVNNTGTLTSTGNTWGVPIGLGTDPATGIVYGLNDVTLTKWTGTGNATTVGIITGDAIWTSGTSLNDVAVDAGGNLYSIVFSGANTYLYRINPTTLVAKLVVQATGSFITDGTTTNGNGMAYQGDHFYYSRINGANTDLWQLDAETGASVYLGLVTGIRIADLGSCATVTNVPSDFAFNCGAPGAGLQQGNFIITGGIQTNVLRVPIITNATGLATFSVTGAGIQSTPTSYQLTNSQTATYVDIPIIYDGTGIPGSRTLSITVSGAIVTGVCNIPVIVAPCDAGTAKPTLNVTSRANICPLTTVDLSTIMASNHPGGTVVLSWHSGLPATNANRLSSVTALPEGTYYATFYDPTNLCYSGANGFAVTPVTATVSFCCNASTVTPPLNKN